MRWWRLCGVGVQCGLYAHDIPWELGRHGKLNSMWWLAVVAVLISFQPADFNAEGIKALDAERYVEAERAFQQAVENDPEDYSAHFHLALAQSMLGKGAEAIAGYRKVLEIKPGIYEAELNLGILLLDGNQAKSAVTYLESAASKKPKEFRPNYYLADAFYESGEFARAEQHYTTAIRINPKSDAVELGLARTLVKLGRLDDAAVHYHRTAELNSEYKSSLLELASLYEEQGRLPEAIELYKSFTDNPAVTERLGQLLLETGRLDDAIGQLQIVVNDSPTAANRYALATAYLRKDQLDKAEPMLQLALADEPENFDLVMTLGRVLRDQKKYDAAARQFLRAVQQKPDSEEAWSELAGMMILLENYPEALAALDRAESLGRNIPAIHFFRAIILDKARQYKPALESYEKFLEMSAGARPDEEFKARQRIRIIKKELNR